MTPISLRKLGVAGAISLLILLIPCRGGFTPEIRFTFATGNFMALLWLTEAVPMGMAALLPLVLFPLGGVQTAEKIAAPYANSAVFLFLGGFLVASAVEKWGLHRRLAWHVLSVVGTGPRRLVFAVLLATTLLSMWISNTATTLMMAPIAVAIVKGLVPADPEATRIGEGSRRRLGEATLLAVAYGASLGGLATPIGTPTNVIFLGAAKQLFPTAPTVSFAQWMGFGCLYVALAVPLCWFILIGVGRVGKGAPIPLDNLGLERPGPMTGGERKTIVLFGATALLWIFRSDIPLGQALTIPGWSGLIGSPKFINDSTVAIFMAILGFLIPVEAGRRLIDWAEFRKVPWDILILFGGGFALADAMESSGLSKWAGAQLSFVGGWPPVLMVIVIALAVTALSEIASNVATATAMMPVCAALAVTIGVHPYFLMIPAVLAASSGFMLPVATAPNTIAYGTGLIRVKQMARAGAILDVVCSVLITMLITMVIPRILGIDLLHAMK